MFYVFVVEVVIIISSNQSKNINLPFMKKCENLNKMTTKKNLDGYSSTLEFFLVKHTYIFV